jgi:hypothetical protein
MKPNAKITAGSDFDFETWELQLFKPLTPADLVITNAQHA